MNHIRKQTFAFLKNRAQSFSESGQSRSLSGGFLSICLGKENFMVYFFIVLAVSVRGVFWLYTGREWEDAMITLTGVENVWDGFGLTHHVSEPRVHYFTSPMGVLIPIVLHPVFGGLLGLRLVSLIAAIGTIYVANRICKSLEFDKLSTSFTLAFLSFDFLHIFFGMSGMETQVSVFFLLMAMLYTIKCSSLDIAGGGGVVNRNTVLLGVSLGFCMLCRPDFILPCICMGAWLVFKQPKLLLKIIIVAIIVYLPWIIFTYIYYGSPIPNTIVAKSGGIGILERLSHIGKNPIGILENFLSTWKVHAPIYEWWVIGSGSTLFNYFSVGTAIMQFFLVFLAVAGLIYGTIKKEIVLLFVSVFFVFTLYRIGIVQNTYFMWYLPPYTAIMAILVSAGLNSLSSCTNLKPVARVLCIFLVISYVAPLPFMFSIEKQAQNNIEDGVRRKVGERLAVLMGENDTVALEPLGFVGYYARNKTIYDYPGLGSKIALKAYLENHEFGQFCNKLKPTFLVLRQGNLYGGVDTVRRSIPDFDSEYRYLERIWTGNFKLDSGHLHLNRMGDAGFLIFQRNNIAQRENADAKANYIKLNFADNAASRLSQVYFDMGFGFEGYDSVSEKIPSSNSNTFSHVKYFQSCKTFRIDPVSDEFPFSLVSIELANDDRVETITAAQIPQYFDFINISEYHYDGAGAIVMTAENGDPIILAKPELVQIFNSLMASSPE